MRLLSKASYRFNAIPIKMPMVHPTELRQILFKLYGNTKTPNSQNKLEKGQNWWYRPQFETILQNYSHQNSMVPAQKQTPRSMAQNRQPRNKLTLIWSSILVWRIPWTQDPGGLQSMGSQRVRHDRATNAFTFTIWSINLQHRRQEYTTGKRQPFQ